MLFSTYVLCDFIESTLLKSSGKICGSPLPSLLLDELSMDKRNSDGFFSIRLACKTSDRSNHSTNSSLVTVDYQQRFLACFVCVSADQVHAIHMLTLVVTL